MANRTCDSCGYKLPFGHRRNRRGDQMICDGCDPSKPGQPGRPVGHHGARDIEESLMKCQACHSEMGPRGLVRVGGLLRCADGCPTRKTAAALPTEGKVYDFTWPVETGAPFSERGLVYAAREGYDGVRYLLADGNLRYIDPAHFTEAKQVSDPSFVEKAVAAFRAETTSGRVDYSEFAVQNRNAMADAFARMGSLRTVAHDFGDGKTIAHCPFCGSGQLTGRSDGTAQCEFCNASFTVQVQPEFPSMPQTIDGERVQDPSMPGADGEIGSDAEDAAQDDAAAPGADEFAPAGSAATDPGAFAPAGTSRPAPDEFAPAGTAVARRRTARFRTEAGDLLPEDAYLRHLALLETSDRAGLLARMRGSRG